MNALKLKLYQQMACYKKPFAFKVSETYPLPPYSTVKGMLHSLLDATTFIPMKISIQGTYDTLINDYQTHYFFKKNKTDEFAITLDGLGVNRDLKDITTMPIYMHLLYDVHLIIHVDAEKHVLEQIKKQIEGGANQHLSLGRWEDLVRVDACEFVELQPCDEEPILKYNAYIPIQHLEDENYFPYKLNWKYEVKNGVRTWEKIHVGYVQQGTIVSEFDDFYIDSCGDLVFFNE